MKLLNHSVSHTRRALCASTLVMLAGAIAASAQSGAGSGAGAGGAGSQTYNQSGTGAGTTTSSRRNTDSTSAQSSNAALGTQNQTGTSGTYSTGTRSGSTDSTYGTTGSTHATGSMSGSSDKLSWGDKRFVTKAADHGQSEVQLAQLAAQQASNPEVRRFAQRLVNDHTRVNSELMSLASNKNVKLDQESGQDRTYRRLSNRQGQDFDREFIEQMIDMHEADVKLFEKAAQDAKDQELRSFASRHVGHLREHLQQAQSLRSTIMPTGRTEDNDTSGSATSTTGSSSSATGASGANSAAGAYQSHGTSSAGSTVADPTASGRDATRTNASGPARGSGSSTTSERNR